MTHCHNNLIYKIEIRKSTIKDLKQILNQLIDYE